MPTIELKDVTKRFGPTTVIENLNLAMQPREFTVLVGPSGCGKSTTLRMIAGLEEVTSGQILIDGRDVVGLEPKERGLAMVFQDYALYPHMTVRKNMSFALRLQRMDRAQIDRRVNEAAELLGLAPLLDRKPAALSGGQRQRVAMGRVLVRDAETFLFDEPLSNLDAKLRGTMRAELASLRQRLEKNMIYVTHDQIEAMTLGDRIVVMLDGAIQQAGTPEELYRYPVNRFVAGFIGSPPMNVAEGQMRDASTVRLGGTTLDLGAPVEGQGGGDASGRRVHVGIRPNRLRPAEPGEANRFEGTVRLSEYVGASSVLHMDTPIGPVTVEWDGQEKVRVGETLPLGVEAGDIYLFDASDGRTIRGHAPGETGEARGQRAA